MYIPYKYLSLIAGLYLVCSCKPNHSSTKLQTPIDSLSYFQGVYTAWKLRENGYTHFEQAKYKEGFESVAQDKGNYEKQTQAGNIIAQKLAQGIKAYFNANKQKKGIITTTSGLQYEILESGYDTLKKPKLGDKIKLTYTATRIDGIVFDHLDKGTMTFTGRTPGLKEGIQYMHIGSTYRFYIPPHLDILNNLQGTPPKVYPFMPSIYEIKLLDILPEKQ